MLSWRPHGIRSEESVHDTDLVGDHQPEPQTEQPGCERQPLEKLLPASNQVKCGGDSHRNQHHSDDRSHAKDQQIGY